VPAGTGPALQPPMTSHRSLDSMPAGPRQVRFLPATLGVLAVLVGLAAAPSEAQGQLRSGIASVALTAYAAPASTWQRRSWPSGHWLGVRSPTWRA
jgi:hypothetical protein